MTHKLMGLAIGLALAAGVGCSGGGGGGGSTTPQEAALQEVADLIRASSHPGGKGPSKLSDFDKVQGMYPQGYQAVKSGEVVVIWGAAMKGEGEAAKGGGDVVAYEKDAPTNGGFVLLSSGQVKKMSAAEFNSAPKAAGKK